MAASVILHNKTPKATSSTREPITGNSTNEIRNCTSNIIASNRRVSTLTNTVVNRLVSESPEVSREKNKLLSVQKLTQFQLGKLQSLLRNNLPNDRCCEFVTISELPGDELLLPGENIGTHVDVRSVCTDSSERSVCVESSKNPPECLFVLNPRLFGMPVQIGKHSFVALLDSGATEDFISKRVVDSLRCPLLKLKTPTLVKVATGAEQRVDKFVNLFVSLVSICIPMSFMVIDMEPECQQHLVAEEIHDWIIKAFFEISSKPGILLF